MGSYPSVPIPADNPATISSFYPPPSDYPATLSHRGPSDYPATPSHRGLPVESTTADWNSSVISTVEITTDNTTIYTINYTVEYDEDATRNTLFLPISLPILGLYLTTCVIVGLVIIRALRKRQKLTSREGNTVELQPRIQTASDDERQEEQGNRYEAIDERSTSGANEHQTTSLATEGNDEYECPAPIELEKTSVAMDENEYLVPNVKAKSLTPIEQSEHATEENNPVYESSDF